MIRKLLIFLICLVTASVPIQCLGDSAETIDSGSWTKLVHEENSLAASILYLPYIAIMVPYRIVDGILFPKPTTQATIPPAAHKAGH